MTKLLIQNILANALAFNWSTQGLGMLRLYLSDEVRLHVWDSSLRTPGVSPLHTHPWDLKSEIVAGIMHQFRFTQVNGWTHEPTEEFNSVKILCGAGAHEVDPPTKVKLVRSALETYAEGSNYVQDANEIHWSLPEDGTVTLITRTFKADRDHALVLWRGEGGFVSAEPRPASADVVAAVCDRALRTWFGFGSLWKEAQEQKEAA